MFVYRTGQAIRRVNWRAAALTVSAAMLMGTSLAACAPSDSSPEATGESAELAPPADDPASIKAMITNLYGQDIPASDIPPTVLSAIEVAAAPASPELVEKAKSCFGEAVCETGRGDLTIGLPVDDVNNVVNLQAQAAALLQALRYPNVKRIIMTDGRGDLATAISNLRSLISQRVDIIMYNTGYGSSLGQVAKQATDAGIILAVKDQPIAGIEPGENVLFAGGDNCAYGKDKAEWATGLENAPSGGRVALLGGVPGNSYDSTWHPCAEKALAEQGWEVGTTGWTEWTPQGEAQAASALMASGEKLDAVLYSGGCEHIVEAYNATDTPPPAFSAAGVNPSCVKAWQSAQGTDLAFEASSGNSHTWLAPLLITAAIERKARKTVDDEYIIEMPAVPFEALVESNPDFASLPAVAVFQTTLPNDLTKELLGAAAE